MHKPEVLIADLDRITDRLKDSTLMERTDPLPDGPSLVRSVAYSLVEAKQCDLNVQAVLFFVSVWLEELENRGIDAADQKIEALYQFRIHDLSNLSASVLSPFDLKRGR